MKLILWRKLIIWDIKLVYDPQCIMSWVCWFWDITLKFESLLKQCLLWQLLAGIYSGKKQKLQSFLFNKLFLIIISLFVSFLWMNLFTTSTSNNHKILIQNTPGLLDSCYISLHSLAPIHTFLLICYVLLIFFINI